MIESPLLSLIVATLGRRNELVELLQSIPAHNHSHIEVLVVDQNEHPLTDELAQVQTGLTVRHFHVHFRNASAARNFGAERAVAGWLMFPDDDATFLPDTIDELLLLIRKGQHDLISGQIVNREGVAHLLQWLLHPAAIEPDNLDNTLVESSFAIRRDLFIEVSGFDPLFGPGSPFHSAEGADLVRRLWRQGRPRTWFTPTISLHHPAKDIEATAIARERIRHFAIGEGAFIMRHHQQLPMLRIGRKLIFRMAGTLITSGETRRRKIAFLKGFYTGAFLYLKLQRERSVSAQPSSSRIAV